MITEVQPISTLVHDQSHLWPGSIMFMFMLTYSIAYIVHCYDCPHMKMQSGFPITLCYIGANGQLIDL